jgi:hypothetical protein
MTSELEPANFRLVAQYLNQLRYRVFPSSSSNSITIYNGYTVVRPIGLWDIKDPLLYRRWAHRRR